MDVSEQVKNIKRSFRLYMNGVTANSMRQKGLEYKINWGVSQSDLRRMALDCGKDKKLADALWKEDSIRECKLLATLIMPAEEMDNEHALKWANEIDSFEIMEFTVFNLFQYIVNADILTQDMLKSENLIVRMGAYNLMCRIVKNNTECRSEVFNTLFIKASSDIQRKPTNYADRQILHALINCLDGISVSDTEYAKKSKKILVDAGLDAF